MSGLLHSMQGFCIIGIVIGVGYVAARLRIAGSHAQMVLNRMCFFVSMPCLMFTLISHQQLDVIMNNTIVVAFLSAVIVAIIFNMINVCFLHLSLAKSTICTLDAVYINANNIGLPIATYILGKPELVVPLVMMQQLIFTPITLILLDIGTTKSAGWRNTLKQLTRQPILFGSFFGVIVALITQKIGYYPIANAIATPLQMIANTAVPMILMAFGMSLYTTKVVMKGSQFTLALFVSALKNSVMPLVAFLLGRFVMHLDAGTLWAVVTLAALPTGQSVYNFASRYNTCTQIARDGTLISTLTSPLFITAIAVLLG